MDPVATLARMIEAFQTGDTAEALEAAQDLAQWMDRGGFRPAVLDELAHILRREVARR